MLSKKEHFVIGDNLSDFFDFINKTDLNNEWKNDYSVRVCDGSIWEMRLRYNDRTVKLIKGNVCLPKNGRKIKKMIEDMLSIDKSIELPIIYGC